MKRLFALILSILMLTGVALATDATEPEAELPAPVFVDATIVTKVIDEGQIVTGVRLEWDIEFLAGQLTTSSFAVNGYTIIGLYINNDGVWKHAETAGKYVFLEFEEPAGIGTGTYNTLQYKEGSNLLRDLTIDIQCFYDMNLYTATGYIHTEVDDYLALSETNDDYTTPYRLFIPEGWENASLPLVIWLHGGGERGDNNHSQLAANRGALNFSDVDAQAQNPCFVLAPQAQSTGWDGESLVNIESIVRSLIDDYNIDGARIYVSGCSMGGSGSKSLMYAYPDMIAASLVTANGRFTDVEEEIQILSEIPVWLITAADDSGGAAGETVAENVEFIRSLGYNLVAFLDNDGLNGFLRGEDAAIDARRVIEAAEAADSIMLVSTYKVGTVLPAAHWSWMAATDNTAVHDWLFSQVNEAPYPAQ
ncbi:MAG: hypothetical protein ACOYI5_10630 [Christensenellales bacterium]